jgi:dGTP triphosphohydrolase
MAQIGHKKILEATFKELMNSVQKSEGVLPQRYRELLDAGSSKGRVIADYISGLTESQVFSLYDKLHGHTRGSAFDYTA